VKDMRAATIAEAADAAREAQGWFWMEGRTCENIHGGYIARIISTSRDSLAPHPEAKPIGAWSRHRGVQWEIEGYGATREDALADLERKLRL